MYIAIKVKETPTEMCTLLESYTFTGAMCLSYQKNKHT